MCISEGSVELGAKCAIFEADEKTLDWLSGRVKNRLSPVTPDPDASYEDTVEIDISKIGPQVAKPHFVGNAVPIEEVGSVPLDQAFIGTCSNGRLEDLHMAAKIVKGKRVCNSTRFLITPASREIYTEAAKDGTLAVLSEAGAIVTNSACGACTGFMGVLADGENCLAAAPRNFMGRMGSPKANIYLASPATVAASALRGAISDPRSAEI
jgi:3-isopropylmalate/(R)-2-methylmalate dehydratase large subunit